MENEVKPMNWLVNTISLTNDEYGRTAITRGW